MKKKHLVNFEISKLRALKREAKKLGISFAELLRRITDAWFEKNEKRA